MSTSLRCLLSVLAAGILVSHWEVAGDRSLSTLPPVPDPGPCCPAQNATAYVGLRGYRRFHANDSLIGRHVPCTREDKICFRHNLIFDPEQDVCDSIGGGHDTQCDLRPDAHEFHEGSGRLIGECKTYEDPCPGYRMAYDGHCYPKEVVRDVMCGCDAKPTRHFLGGVECRSSPATPIHTQQPEDEGCCVIPDLRFPDTERSEFFKNPFTSIQGFRGTRTGISFGEDTPRLKCDPLQAACFSEGRAQVSGTTGCYRLLEQGPCPQEHVVALDIHSAVKGRAEAKCVHSRGGCPEVYKRMVFDGKCHEDREIEIEAPGRIVQNQYGQYVLIPHGFDLQLSPKKDNGFCKVDPSGVGPGLFERRPNPPCGPNDKNKCDLYEVVVDHPKPEF